MTKTLPWYLALCVLAVGWAGCDGEPSPSDAGRDAPSSFDASDAPTASDGGTSDGGGTADSGGTSDAGTDGGCTMPLCEPLEAGCHYEGATACDCGTVVCEGTLCSPACNANQFCDRCAAAQACVPRPEDMGNICPAIFMPVCGCDGRTYSNGCALASAGVSLLHDGECTTECGDVNCDPGQSCQVCAGPGGTFAPVCIPSGAAC